MIPSIQILCLMLGPALYSLAWINAFIIPNHCHPHSSNSVCSSTKNAILPQHQRSSSSFATTKLLATVEKGSMSSTKDMGKGRQKVLFQKVIRPTPEMPDVLFLGYLIEYLERHFELPTDLPMVYENMVVNEFDNDLEDGVIDVNDDETGKQTDDRYTLAWDSPLSPSADATRMEVEVVGIYTDDTSKQEPSTSSPASPSVPNMAMVVVRRPNNNNADGKKAKSLPPMMQGLFEDSEKRILQALDRGLDDFVAGRIKFELNDDLAELRTEGDLPPPNVQTAMEAIEAEIVPEEESTSSQKQRQDPQDVVFDAYATTEKEEEEEEPPPKPKPTQQEIADAKARAMATMQKPAQDASTTQTATRSSSGDASVDFAVEAAKQKAAAAAAATKKDAPSKPALKKAVVAPSDSATSTVDFAVEAARKAMARRKQKQEQQQQQERQQSSQSATAHKEDFAVAAARKMAANPQTKRKPKAINKPVRGTSPSKADAKPEPQLSEGPSMPPIPDGWKPKDYFRDQRAFSGTISSPKTFATKQTGRKRKSVTKSRSPPKQRASAVAAKISSRSNDAKPNTKPNSKPAVDPEGKEDIGNRKLNAKFVDEGDDKSVMEDPFLKRTESLDSTDSSNPKVPSQKDIEAEVLKAAKTALDEMEGMGYDMTPEEMLQDVLKFDEEKKKEEKPGSGFATGAFEKAKELMKDRHRQIQERKKLETQQQQNQQVGFKEVETPDANAFPKHPNPSSEESKRKLTPEEELREMFAAGQRIAEGKITTAEPNAESSIQAAGTTEEDVDRLIAEEKTISKYARVLDDELAELEVRINTSPGEELDGPPQNPLFDVMSGPEVYDPNVELDAVNYPGAIPGTADVKLPKQLDEAMKQAEFAASVLMQLEEKETKDEVTGETTVQYFAGTKELTQQQVENLRTVVEGAVNSGIIDDPVEVMAEASRLQLVLDELWNQPEERFHEIASSYKDLLLSDRFVLLIRERLRVMADRDLDALRRDDESLREPHEKERELLGRLVNYAQALLKETRALGAELEAHQLEIVRSICKVAMDPAHTTEEETANALSDAVRDMRPLLDDAFVAYLKYAVAEEESRLARAGLLDDPDYNQWLFVLKIVQQGVYAEIAKGINRYIDHIWYVLRMETPRQRRQLLSDLIDDMPTMDVRPFVQVVDNIVGSLGDGVNGNFDGLVPLGEMTNSLLQLQNDVKELLPPERINKMSKDADEWAARQKKRLLQQRQIGEQRLEAAKEAAQRESDVDAAFGESGEVLDRFD